MDVLPEYFPYRDDGCDVSASCLECFLRQCKYDDPGKFHRERRAHRDQQVLETRLRDGVTIIELSRRFHISLRTVHRILASANNNSLERLVNGQEERPRPQSEWEPGQNYLGGGESLHPQEQSRNRCQLRGATQ